MRADAHRLPAAANTLSAAAAQHAATLNSTEMTAMNALNEFEIPVADGTDVFAQQRFGTADNQVGRYALA